ncbi:hypothetical protein PLUA15_80040 [Pseudomonas lundensis]|uniref:Uncharacterized protein n=1 Tax=Pseudomonas lundensis TaxID=86185 RepID=A0AAX2HEI3_9PSED|nr:hypothetical protein PLUA15_80040 [Pseudomonas lundensis]
MSWHKKNALNHGDGWRSGRYSFSDSQARPLFISAAVYGTPALKSPKPSVAAVRVGGGTFACAPPDTARPERLRGLAGGLPAITQLLIAKMLA